MMFSILEIFLPAMVKTEKSRVLIFPTSAGLAYLARVGDIAGFTGFRMRSGTEVFGAHSRWLKRPAVLTSEPSHATWLRFWL